MHVKLTLLINQMVCTLQHDRNYKCAHACIKFIEKNLFSFEETSKRNLPEIIRVSLNNQKTPLQCSYHFS